MAISDSVQRLFENNAPSENASAWRIGIVTAQFNDHITGALLSSTKQTLLAQGILEANIIEATVPGAFELPLAAQWLIEHSKVDAVITLGCVIQGETPHFDYVCAEAARGVQDVQLKTGMPVVFGVLTTHTEAQALDRTSKNQPASGGNSRHSDKGIDCAITALHMLGLKQQLP
jgi:6,7-dimethyl-8-ribityllumazine synthase